MDRVMMIVTFVVLAAVFATIIFAVWFMLVVYPQQDAECIARGGVPERGRGIYLCLDPDSLK